MILKTRRKTGKKRAANMHHVYLNSLCNIAGYGCFFARNPNTFKANIVRPNWKLIPGKAFVIVQPTELPRQKIAESETGLGTAGTPACTVSGSLHPRTGII